MKSRTEWGQRDVTGTYGQRQGEGMNCNGKRGKFLYFWLVWEFDSRIAENLISHGDVFQAERQPRHRLDLSRYLTSPGAGTLGTCLTLAFDEDTHLRSCLQCKDRK